jgi:hypothetical protein
MVNKLVVSALVSAAVCGNLRAQEYEKFTVQLGGGLSTPINPTGAFAGVSGNFVFSAGYNLNKKSAILGEFFWSGLPSNRVDIQPIAAPYSRVNLFSLGVNYRHQFDRLKGSPFGAYVLGGGGWYNRYVNIDKDYPVPGGTVCQPLYNWWGYACDSAGYVYTHTLATKGSNSGGFNTGVGFFIRFSDSNWRFFTEARYHYAFTERIPTTLIPVTMGLRLN